MVFSKFFATTIFIPAENTRHSEFPGHIPGDILHHHPYITKLELFVILCVFRTPVKLA
jgi:hypothetical protein